MIDPSIIEEIKNDPFLRPMNKRVVAFDKYLNSTSNHFIRIRGLNESISDTGQNNIEPVQYDKEYTHRWTKKYDNLVLQKLYNLQWYYRLNPDKTPKYTMMVTLTGTHATPRNPQKGGLNHMAFMSKFHSAHQKSKDMIRKYLKTNQYLSMLEGHPESGYVHAHDLYLQDELPSEKTIRLIENHWNKTLGMGSAKHGIKIEVKEPHDFKDIKSFIAYPMSYIGKTSIGAISEWTKYDVIFNTCLWLSPRPKRFGGIGHRVRAFQPSRALSKIMSRKVSDNGFIHIETSLTHKKQISSKILSRSPHYDINNQAWYAFGGDSPIIDCKEQMFD